MGHCFTEQPVVFTSYFPVDMHFAVSVPFCPVGQFLTSDSLTLPIGRSYVVSAGHWMSLQSLVVSVMVPLAAQVPQTVPVALEQLLLTVSPSMVFPAGAVDVDERVQVPASQRRLHFSTTDQTPPAPHDALTLPV